MFKRTQPGSVCRSTRCLCRTLHISILLGDAWFVPLLHAGSQILTEDWRQISKLSVPPVESAETQTPVLANTAVEKATKSRLRRPSSPRLQATRQLVIRLHLLGQTIHDETAANKAADEPYDRLETMQSPLGLLVQSPHTICRPSR